MKKQLEPGIFVEKKIVVTPEMAASRFHESSPPVLSSPSLITYLQTTCADAIAPFLDENELAVTVRMETTHLASTPVGMKVTIRAEVVRVDDKRVYFKVEAHDEVEKIAEGYNDMFIIDEKRFERGVERKIAKMKS